MLKRVPRGKVTTYGLLAKALRRPKASRAVGSAMRKNPFAPKVPCHRVVRCNGLLGQYTNGVLKKASLLKREGVRVRHNKIVDFQKKLYRF